jgi:hypothetical protein
MGFTTRGKNNNLLSSLNAQPITGCAAVDRINMFFQKKVSLIHLPGRGTLHAG